MNISIKESLEHICDVFRFFGIDYITADLLRRGKFTNKGKKKKQVIIKYNFLINDLCLLYCFEFKRKFKPTYTEYVKKELLRVEEEIYAKGKNKTIICSGSCSGSGSGRKEYLNHSGRHTNDLHRRAELGHSQGLKEENTYPHDEGDMCAEDNDDEKDDDDEEEDDDEEDHLVEELEMDNISYSDDFIIISPMVVLILEYFEYPRLYYLLKCNFQMCKELLLCIGFLIDSTKMLEHYDKRQAFYESFFRNLSCASSSSAGDRTSANGKQNNYLEKKKSVPEKPEEGMNADRIYHVINEAMLLLSNRPYDLELFQYKYMYHFLNELKTGTRTSGYENLKQCESIGGSMKNFCEYKENGYLKKKHNTCPAKNASQNLNDNKCQPMMMNDNFANTIGTSIPQKHDIIEVEEELSLPDYVSYDYAIYQENFIDRYSRNWDGAGDESAWIDPECDSTHRNESDELRLVEENINKMMYIKKLTRNVNKHCNQLIQLQRKTSQCINQLQHLDRNRLFLFNKFNSLVSAYTEPHNVVVNMSDSGTLSNSYNGKKCVEKLQKKMTHKQKKVNLMNNVLFTVHVDLERDKEYVENKLCRNEQIILKENKKNKNIAPAGKSTVSNYGDNSQNISGNSKFSQYGFHLLNDSKNTNAEFFEEINYDNVLADKVTINEFLLLNDTPLYDKICHIYKSGVHFFHFEQLRAVFWLWLQSIFPDTIDDLNNKNPHDNSDKTIRKEDVVVPVDLFDINNNKFFYDNIVPPADMENLYIHILSDLNNFERNVKLLKEYLFEKGCTIGYNKVGKGGKANDQTNRLNGITKYVNDLHAEFVAYYNYKKKAKDLCDEMFVEFLETKKKNMTINSSVEKEDYTNLANIINRHLIGIDNILKYNPILDFTKMVDGIKNQSFIRTEVNVIQLDCQDWYNMYIYHRKKRKKARGITTEGENNSRGISTTTVVTSSNGTSGKHFPSNHIINFMTNSNYKINEKPKTYASTIFNYSDQFISNNDIYTFSENIIKSGEDFDIFVKGKRDKCVHNFHHLLRKVERYMNCVAYNL
ncbi:hypothetical protein, conserved [Plasmodium gonderi]|uniref:Uncharacterized protein n=1 Tax=Plasmodium gonderi TaxID=77519 RepID=A0A1Y1JB54_PLAGO|nr:hypothetical protein, conserved [Plasmodium gonderi]GAW78918.1 hypothetical protein, conserved [Plasmodium gonderi]